MSDAMTQAREWVEANKPADFQKSTDSLAALLTETRTKALSEKEAEIGRLREALRALVDAPLTYNAACIEIECNSHQDAMGCVRNARAALKAEGGEK